MLTNPQIAEGTVIQNESVAVLTHVQSHGASVVGETNLSLDAVYFGAAMETFWQDLEGQILG